MGTATLTIPDEVKADFKGFPWVNWSELAREETLKKEEMLEKVKEFEEIVSKSKLTEEDAIKLADEVNRSLSKKYAGLLKRKK